MPSIACGHIHHLRTYTFQSPVHMAMLGLFLLGSRAFLFGLLGYAFQLRLRSTSPRHRASMLGLRSNGLFAARKAATRYRLVGHVVARSTPGNEISVPAVHVFLAKMAKMCRFFMFFRRFFMSASPLNALLASTQPCGCRQRLLDLRSPSSSEEVQPRWAQGTAEDPVR